VEIKRLQLGNFGVNCYIVTIKENTFIIDPGAEPEAIIRQMDSIGKRPSFILNTHGHYDHIGAIPHLLKEYDIPFYIDKAEKDIVENPDRNMSSFFSANGLSLNTYKIIDERFKSELKDLGIVLLNTPGHTPGSISILAQDDSIFTGDLLFKGSVGRTDLPGGDISVIKESLKKIKGLNKRIQVMPGHGPVSSIGSEIEGNPYFRDDFL